MSLDIKDNSSWGQIMANITIIYIGVYESPIIPSMLELNDVELDIICNNILDFELPPKVENAAPIWHRHELRNTLGQIGPKKFEISSSLKNLLKENDRMELDEQYLGVTSHISQIEQNSKDLFVAYNLLQEQTDLEHINLIPLVEQNKQINIVMNKKIAPLRYYHLSGKLFDKPLPENIDKKKVKERNPFIVNRDEVLDIKLSEPALKSMQESDLVFIIPTDKISLGVLVSAEELEKQITNIQTPMVMIWPFQSSETKLTEEEVQLAGAIGNGLTLDDFAKDLSYLTDYVILQKSEKEALNNLRKHGCHVLLSEFYEDDMSIHPNLLKTLLGVADLKSHLPDSADEEFTSENNVPSVDDENAIEETVEAETAKELETLPEEGPKTGKQISQLVESPEEAGKERGKDQEADNAEIESSNLDSLIDDLTKRENEIDEESKPLKSNSNPSAKQNGDKKEMTEVKEETTDKEVAEVEDAEIEEKSSEFSVREEEDWIDTAKRAIEQSFEHNNEEALDWLIEESGNDSDREMQIAEFAISAWLESRSTPDRKSGAEIISMISQNHRETYIQILQRHMVQAVKEVQEDRRRLMIPLLAIMYTVDVNFSESLIRAITKDLASLNDDEEISVVEMAKLSILQLVIPSRRLTRITIQELLNILESRPNAGPEIWNILIAFDAGSVSLELVTNFSISKAEEIIRRSNLLRFTGSYYSTITKVIQAWKDGDKAAISAATGSILPEETLRKFERLELARKLDKLKMVQLTTLADSLGKDTETVERLITELIVNDELKAEMKLIDDKMYLVSATEENKNNGK